MTQKARIVLSAPAVSAATAAGGLRPGITSRDLPDGLANPSKYLTCSGDYTGLRFTPLTQITPANAGQLAPQWTFQSGVLYVTCSMNHSWVIDARSGRQIWHDQLEYLRAAAGTR